MSPLCILRALVIFWSDQCSRVLASSCLRHVYHLWVAALVIFGPLLQYYVNPRTIFANHRNFFNIKFVQSAWGWTCLLLGGHILLTTYISTHSVLSALRHLSRLVVGGAVWVGSSHLFLLIEDVTGSCFQPVPEGRLLLLPDLMDKRSCEGEGYRWRGYDVSGHTFMLTYCCLTIAEEVAVFRHFLERGRPAGVPLRIVFLLNAALLALWNFMLLCTVVYFHEYSHKVVGAALGTLCWHLTYRWWYRSRWSPGRPGHGLFHKNLDVQKTD
ncbi:fat storage-inducing transmembrane protein 1 [Microcaecilia unicolor]|uniref:Fat storage-inducing transmembrane protein 1 n=1 Tax=Microcaecilia unicolor TaxID=1415580 RepID=A0A6P7WVF1_9AMPH|nr:fat storage-inducing transmembrane protein 1 [Microcaecilia unicolor]